MRGIIDSLLRVRPILGVISALFFFGFPLSDWADQYGRTAGNVAVVVTGLLFSAVASMWIDEFTSYSNLIGWKRFLLKNGLRFILLLAIFIPFFGFILDPTITIAYSHTESYESGKPLRINLYLSNKNQKEKWVKGMYKVYVVKPTGETRQALERQLWAATVTANNSAYVEFPVALPSIHPRLGMIGPVLTMEQAKGLSDRSMVIYFMGVLQYHEWYGYPRRIEFCGSYRDDPRFMIMCDEHSNFFSGSKKLEKLRP